MSHSTLFKETFGPHSLLSPQVCFERKGNVRSLENTFLTDTSSGLGDKPQSSHGQVKIVIRVQINLLAESPVDKHVHWRVVIFTAYCCRGYKRTHKKMHGMVLRSMCIDNLTSAPIANIRSECIHHLSLSLNRPLTHAHLPPLWYQRSYATCGLHFKLGIGPFLCAPEFLDDLLFSSFRRQWGTGVLDAITRYALEELVRCSTVYFF